MIAFSVDSWLTEGETATYERADRGGAATLANRNTILLTLMSMIGGLVIYGYLGMYPTFLRESLKYSPTAAGTVVSFYGLGTLGSIGGGWLGDRFSPRLVLSATFFCTAALGYLLFHGIGGLRVPGDFVLHLGTDCQRRDLRQSGGLSRQSAAEQLGQPRFRHLRDQPVWIRRLSQAI